MNVPVSHKARKFRVAVASKQLDAVGSHGVESDSGKYVAL
jgi:hypothetical protein